MKAKARAGLARELAGLWSLLVRAAPGPTAWYAVLTLLTGAMPMGAAVLTKLVLDDIAAGAGFPVLPVALLGALGVVAAAVPNLTGYVQSEMDRRLDLVGRRRLYRAVDGFTGLGRFEDPAFLDRLRLAEQSVGSALAPGTTGLFGLARDTVSALGLLGALFSLNPVLTALVVLAAGPGLVAQLSMSKHRTRLIAELSPRVRRQIFYGSLLSDVRAAKEVRLLGLGRFLQHRMFTELRAIQAADRLRDRAELRSQSMFVLLGACICRRVGVGGLGCRAR